MVDWNDSFWDKMIDEAKKEEEATQRGLMDSPILNMEQGDYFVRALPPHSQLENPREEMFRAYGHHWNVFAGNEAPPLIGCPKITWAENCRICEAIDELIATRQMSAKDIFAMKGFGVKKKFFLRVVVLKYKPKEKDGKGLGIDLPAVKLIPLSARAKNQIVSILDGELEMSSKDKTRSRKLVFDPKIGRVLKITKNENIDNWWSVSRLDDDWPLEDEFLDESTWVMVNECLPDVHEKDVDKLMIQHQEDIIEVLAPFARRIGSLTAESRKLELPPAKGKKKAKEPEIIPSNEELDTDDLQRQLENL